MASTSKNSSAVIDRLTEAFGSFPTLYGFTLILGSYIAWNVIPGLHHFDPYPFEFMTFSVSILANYQTLIVAISQKGQLLRDREASRRQDKQLETLVALTEGMSKMLHSDRQEIKKIREDIADHISKLPLEDANE